MTTLFLPNEAASEALGAVLAQMAEIGDFIALKGPLGAGKSTLARGFVHECQKRAGVPLEDVVSPTFTLVQTYEAGPLAICHCDFYRLESSAEIHELGIEDALDEGVVIAEWPDRMGDLIPQDRLEIVLAHPKEGQATGRQAILTAKGENASSSSRPGSWADRLRSAIDSGLFARWVST